MSVLESENRNTIECIKTMLVHDSLYTLLEWSTSRRADRRSGVNKESEYIHTRKNTYTQETSSYYIHAIVQGETTESELFQRRFK